ncbi:MAG: hypothetical protein F6K41_31105 [Symploca sp. SIO3E6]|nr:hypothetical protein [Caldora sp. SIO3E6]
MSEKKGGERRSGGAGELSKKRELIIFGYNAQEIPPKISFTHYEEYDSLCCLWLLLR